MKNHETVRRIRLRQKLVSATAMLLISAILMVSSSYAWFVMSTAPEVSNIQTQVGANGALEVALLDSESWSDLSRLDAGDIDESATESLVSANLTWGNLVNLGDNSYGMSQIVLNPSRLYIEENGTDENGKQYAVNTLLLKTPIYGEDGRIMGLDKESTINYICANGQFTEAGHGVRAIGTSSTMSTFQLGMNGARASLLTAMSSARTAASNALNSTGSRLASIVVDYGVSNKESGYTVEDMTAVKDLAVGLQTALDRIDLALRAAFAGYVTTATSGITSENYSAALDAINDPENSLSSLLTTYSGITAVIPSMGTYISTLAADQTAIGTAISACDAQLASPPNNGYTWNTIAGIIEPLMDTDAMTVNGQGIDELKDSLMVNGQVDMAAGLALLSEGITVAVPSGSGILSDIADFAGDYTAKVKVNVTYQGNSVPLDAVMTTKTDKNPVYLMVCSVNLSGAEVADASGVSAITDFFGYAIDLAFRTNAEGTSKLLLQTTPENRVYEGSTENAALQGGGSYMAFTTEAGISATKMVRLMQGLRVVFMDEEQKILSIAVLDCTLGKDIYTLITDGTADEYAYLDNGNSYQISDVLTQAEYNALPPTSGVVIDKETHEIKAPLYLHAFSMTENEAGDYTGATSIGAMKSEQSITTLEQDQAKIVTALVYLDGSYVTNAMVAANATQSLTGVLNLQFSSDAELIPAEFTHLRSGDDDNQSQTPETPEEPEEP